MFKNWQYTLLEGDGAGETFWVALLMRNPGLKVNMEKTGGKAKHYRQERELGPALEMGMVMVSDADTPFLNALRKALDDFPGGNNDIRDAIYWLMRTCPDVITLPVYEEGQPVGKKREKFNPFVSLGRA